MGCSPGSRQASVSRQQTEILFQQKELAKIQYYAEHRPRLVVRDIYFTNRHDFESITIEIGNIGGSPLSITSALARMWYMATPDLRSFKYVGGENPGQILMSEFIGENLPNGTTWVIIRATPAEIVQKLSDPKFFTQKSLFIFGIFNYDDKRGEPNVVNRETVFRRRWDPASRIFENVAGHEFSD